MRQGRRVSPSIPAQPGKRDELVKALQAAIDNANTEEGTLTYILHTDDKDPDAVFFYELYTDQDALTAHGTSDCVQGDRQGASATSPAAVPSCTILKPVGGKGL